MKRLIYILFLLNVIGFSYMAHADGWFYSVASSVTCTDFGTLPTADYSVVWSRSTGADCFAMVDDPIGTPDDDATYIYRTTNNSPQYFTTRPTLAAGCDTITSLILRYRAKREYNVDGTQMRGDIVVGGTVYNGSDKTLTDSWADYTNTWSSNPKRVAACVGVDNPFVGCTGAGTGTVPWTHDDLEGTGTYSLDRWGLETRGLNGTGEQVDVTQAYPEVNYP